MDAERTAAPRPAGPLARRLAQVRLVVPLLARHLTSRAPLVDPSSATVVSLTTHGRRARLVFLTLESVGWGRSRPRAVVLWLDDDALLSSPPRTLRRLVRRGLQVRRSENFGPHTKYYPYVRDHADDGALLVTADDDIVYPRDWLHELEQAAAAHGPGTVVCHRARVIHDEDGRLAPYRTWPLATSTGPSPRLLATGVGGVAYPPVMQRLLRDAGEAFRRHAPRADDIWLHAVALRAGVPVRQVSSTARQFPVLPASQGESLMATNVHGTGNDDAVAGTYTAEDVARISSSSLLPS